MSCKAILLYFCINFLLQGFPNGRGHSKLRKFQLRCKSDHRNNGFAFKESEPGLVGPLGVLILALHSC